MAKPSSYKDAGVDIDVANDAMARIKDVVKSTHNKNVLTGIGTFGSLFRFPQDDYTDPILVSSTDSVGTKLKLAFWSNDHSTVGQDIVNHCVNDILCQGAKPLFILDYYATSKLKPAGFTQLIEGMSKACKENGCALVGGETCELPDLYNPDEYDLALTVVGVVDKEELVTGETISERDAIIGLPSSGLHTNGYSLAIKLLLDNSPEKIDDDLEGIGPVKDALMAVHKSYLKPVSRLLDAKLAKGIAHITGGGFIDNIPRILPKDVDAAIEKSAWEVPPLFRLIQEEGSIDEQEMFRTFNMGIGIVVVTAKEDADKTLSLMKNDGAVRIGEIKKGTGKVLLT